MILLIATLLSVLSIGSLIFFLKPFIRRTLFIISIIAGVLFCSIIIWQVDSASYLHTTIESRVSNRPIEVPTNGYIGSNKCQTCHIDKHATWYDTYHRTMTQVATKNSIATNVHNVSFINDNLKYILTEDDEKLWVSISDLKDAHSPTEKHEIVMTTGSHHYQVYWYETSSPRILDLLPYVYLISEKKWVPRYSVFLTPPQDHYPEEYGRWNTICIRCHTTNGRPRQIEIGGTKFFDTQVSEFGISCEACHGPGQKHAKGMSNPLTRYL
ncbi:MAG: hypothetical protein ACI909_004107, partial [Planctomycetota bacterium]